MIEQLKNHLRQEEGVKSSAYQDHLGFWTIGVGHLIDERLGGGLSSKIIDMILEDDLSNTFGELDRNVAWWREMPPGPQIALAAMCFQMGWPRLSKFKKTLALLEAGDFFAASYEALDSDWATQTPERADRVSMMMRNE